MRGTDVLINLGLTIFQTWAISVYNMVQRSLLHSENIFFLSERATKTTQNVSRGFRPGRNVTY